MSLRSLWQRFRRGKAAEPLTFPTVLSPEVSVSAGPDYEGLRFFGLTDPVSWVAQLEPAPPVPAYVYVPGQGDCANHGELQRFGCPQCASVMTRVFDSYAVSAEQARAATEALGAVLERAGTAAFRENMLPTPWFQTEEKAGAYERAEQLLLSYLTPEQRSEREREGTITVETRLGTYIIRNRRTQNIRFTSKRRKVGIPIKADVCVAPDDCYRLPLPDVHLSQLLWIRHAEEQLWERANYWGVGWDGRDVAHEAPLAEPLGTTITLDCNFAVT